MTFYEKEGTAKRVIDFYKIKNRNKQRSFRFGGEGGIRTHVSVKTNAFRVRPVMTASILLQNHYLFYHIVQKKSRQED